MRSLRALGICAALAAATASSACAQSGGAPADLAVDSIQPRAQRSRFKGPEGAPVTLYEVSDFQCPYCRQFAQTTMAQLDSAYIRTGKVRMGFIHLPLSNHPQAFAAAEAAMCAGAQSRFWEMHDRLFAAQPEWSGSANASQRFEGYAEALRLDMTAYRECTANDRTASMIIGDVLEARGVNGTPAFFMSGPGGRRSVPGLPTWEVLRQEIEAVLTPTANVPVPQPQN
jgi:protein-disulfide isomerase